MHRQWTSGHNFLFDPLIRVWYDEFHALLGLLKVHACMSMKVESKMMNFLNDEYCIL